MHFTARDPSFINVKKYYNKPMLLVGYFKYLKMVDMEFVDGYDGDVRAYKNKILHAMYTKLHIWKHVDEKYILRKARIWSLMRYFTNQSLAITDASVFVKLRKLLYRVVMEVDPENAKQIKESINYIELSKVIMDRITTKGGELTEILPSINAETIDRLCVAYLIKHCVDSRQGKVVPSSIGSFEHIRNLLAWVARDVDIQNSGNYENLIAICKEKSTVNDVFFTTKKFHELFTNKGTITIKTLENFKSIIAPTKGT